MTDRIRTSGPPLAKFLARRLFLIATVVFLIHTVVIGLYYGNDRRAVEAELVNDQVELVEEALVSATLPADAPVRALFDRYPDAYAFALVNRGGDLLDAMNADLIPPGALELYADTWITALDTPNGRLVVSGHEFVERDGLRMVFVLQDDPAHLFWFAYLDMFYEHVWLPILPLVLLLIGANTFLIRKGLAPVSEAASWARNLRFGDKSPPPDARLPAEISDLVDATQRSFARLGQALEAEKRRAAEAAHALRTPVAVLVARADALPPSDTTDRLREDLGALSRTVQQVLAAARVGGMEKTASLDLRKPAETVVTALAPFAYTQGAELDLVLSDMPVLARAEEEGVELALSNLVENAILHGGQGTVTIVVGPETSIIVRDSGPGLPEDAKHNMFDPFWRGPAASPGGAGLGLAIVERVLNAHGGSVEARTRAEGGAEFVLRWKPAKT